MASKRYNLVQGDTFSLKLTVTLDGVAYDLTGSKLFMTVKRRYEDTDAQALAQITTGAGITHTNAAGGLATATIPAAVTKVWPLNVGLYYDIQILTATGEIHTMEIGTIVAVSEVTIAFI